MDEDWNRWRGRTDQRLDGHDGMLKNLAELVVGVDTKLDTVVSTVTRIETRTTTLDHHRDIARVWKMTIAGIAGSAVTGLTLGLLGLLHR